MSELGDRYKDATKAVLGRYANEKDKLGRCQKWKLDSIEKDRISGHDSGLMKTFAEEVEAEVIRLEAVKVVVQTLCKQACETPKKQRKVAVKPKEPADPNLPHGIDLGWD